MPALLGTLPTPAQQAHVPALLGTLPTPAQQAHVPALLGTLPTPGQQAGAPTLLGVVAADPDAVPPRSYLYDLFPPTPPRAPRVAPAARRPTPPPPWADPVRAVSRVILVGLALALMVLVPLSSRTHIADHSGTWPTQEITGSDRVASLTAPGATVGTGVRLVAAVAPRARVLLQSSYGGGRLSPIPAPVLAVYQRTAVSADALYPSCHLSWSVLAGIGELESGHAASAGALRPGWNGVAHPAILGPVLDGSPGRALVADTDNGRLDHNTHYDRAVGPMQFLPGTWATYAVDADGNGAASPQDINDATATAARYLCVGGVDLSDPIQLATAVDSYNHAGWYVRGVLAAAAGYLAESYGRSQQAVAMAAVAFAYSHLGDPYRFGGVGPLFDCSGLTMASYRSAGIVLPRTSERQWQALPHVDMTNLQAGDLVFFNPGEFVRGLPGHVGIYLGHGYMIDDPHTGAFVRIEPVAGFGKVVGAARPALLVPPRGAPTPGSTLVITVAGAPTTDPGGTLLAGPTGEPSGSATGSPDPSSTTTAPAATPTATPSGTASATPTGTSSATSPPPTGSPTPTPAPSDPSTAPTDSPTGAPAPTRAWPPPTGTPAVPGVSRR